MDGRLYDPVMGRMFSPDPYVMGFALCLSALMTAGQTCKILITYDQNGNVIKREEECTLLPSSAEEAPPYTQNGQQEQETFMDGVAGGTTQSKFHMYPNPASQSVTISLDAESLLAKIERLFPL